MLSACCLSSSSKRPSVLVAASTTVQQRFSTRRTIAFASFLPTRAVSTRNYDRAFLSTHARLQPDEEPDFFVPKKQPPPPPRARPMPPTLESFESSIVYDEYEDYDNVTNAFGAFDYDPFDYEQEEPPYQDFDPLDDDLPSQTSNWQEAAPRTRKVLVNPHDYQEETSTSLYSDKVAEATTTTATDVHPSKETRLESPKSVIATKAPPKAAMPPRASFPSRPPPSDRPEVYLKASSGDAITSQVDMLTSQLHQLEQDIYAQNNNKTFNIKSTKQVSQVLFGDPGQSTNKETLEAMGGSGKVMADLILQHRSLRRQIARFQKKEENRSNGTHVTNVSNVGRKSDSPESIAVANEVVEGDPLLLVDASAYIFRAYFSMPPLHRADGMPVGAVLGFCNMLNRLVLTKMLQGERPRLVLVFDAKGKTFRHDMYDDYKANRPECPMDLIPQFDLIREAAEAYGIHQLEAPYFEADDVIATLASMAAAEGVNSNILSGDKDLWQLVTPQDEVPSIQMIDPMSMSRVSHEVVVSKWGVTPDQLGDVLALAGDSADNVPGVPGIGPKIAASLIGEYGSLEDLLEQVDSVKQKGRREKLKDNMDKARLSRKLVDLERAIPMDKMTFPDNLTSAAELRMEPMNGDRLLAFYEAMGLKDLKRRVQARLTQRKKSSNTKRNNKKRLKAEIPTPEDYEDVPF